jgi:hypothetical protein
MRQLRRLRIHLLVLAGFALLLLGAHAVLGSTGSPHSPKPPTAGVAGSAIHQAPSRHVSIAAAVPPVVVPAPGRAFTISGTLDRSLFIGSTGRLNLAIAAPRGGTLNVTDLAVRVTGTSNTNCTAGNFTVTQYSGSYPLTVPGGSTRTLQQLGVPRSVWPAVTLLDLPVNQDACKNVAVTLTYAGTGQGS